MIAVSNPLLQWSYVTQNIGTILSALARQAELTVIAVVLGFAISLPLGVLVWRYAKARPAVLGFAGVLYTIPSLALFALVQPIVGYFSTTAAEIPLVSYTLLILVRNILAGLDGVPDDVREAARAMGYAPLAQLLRVDLPLALPSIFAGLRVATVTVVGLVTITTFIGQNVLGQLITQGFEQTYNSPIVVALVLSIALASVGDLLFVGLERVTVRWGRSSRSPA
ncbi:MAG: binding-protein-dependent transport system inner rane component [Acidimicrobiaceae bacterium]|nr:binding-protein-dependent transport system inner rane component [Acidimicrobiaceae bacterium]